MACWGTGGFCGLTSGFGHLVLYLRAQRLPLVYVSVDGYPDVNFMLSWANEHWTRNWDGGNREIFLEQLSGNETSWRQVRPCYSEPAQLFI